MKGVILWVVLLFPIFLTGQELIPSELNTLFTQERSKEVQGGSEFEKIKTELYKGYRYVIGPEGVSPIIFKLRNVEKYNSFLEGEGYHLVHDIKSLRSDLHLIVFTSKNVEIHIYANDKEAYIFDLEQNPFKISYDDFYGTKKLESKRFSVYQPSPFEAFSSLSFNPIRSEEIEGIVSFTGGDWIFSRSIQFSLDKGSEILVFPLNEISNDVIDYGFSPNIREKSSFTVTKVEANKILQADNVQVRIVGEKYFEFDLTLPQKYALEDFIKWSEGQKN